ncbi:MAG: sulfatase-like hydrolase/transferase, partial [Pseudomonadota bacterium]
MSARPNILWIVTDHQVHANHNFDQAAFPLQHRLAATGINFTSARTVLPVCSPARASMLTGLYPHAHGLTENDGRFGGRAGLNPDDWLVHQPLLDAGYRCAWFGKWHLDNQRSAADYGFEGFSLPGYGYPYATPEYAAYLKASGLKAPEVHIELRGESGRPEGTTLDLTAERDWFDYEAGCARLEGPVETHEAFFLATAAGAWLEDVGEDPFFLRVDPWGPHPPYVVGGRYAGAVGPG